MLFQVMHKKHDPDKDCMYDLYIDGKFIKELADDREVANLMSPGDFYQELDENGDPVRPPAPYEAMMESKRKAAIFNLFGFRPPSIFSSRQK